MCQAVSSLKWDLENGGVKTAFLQGETQEGQREVYVLPSKDVASMFGIRDDQVMKLEGSVYGLIVAPRRWHFRVQKDMTANGWRQHQLDPCPYMKYGKPGNCIAICGEHVDDFTMGFPMRRRTSE